jgi:membrane fusion protein, hemolysin D
MSTRSQRLANFEDFLPALQRVQEKPPSPLGRRLLWTVLALVAATIAWAVVARLDVVAVADGKLVPAGYLKIVQPTEQGVVKEILVREGQAVREGQVLMHMDSAISDADGQALAINYHALRLGLRRIDAQLAGHALEREASDPVEQFTQAVAQYRANVSAYESALAQERSALVRAREELASAEQIEAKLIAVLPHYRDQERAFEKLTREGYAGRLLYTDKRRERIEREQDLRNQAHVINAAKANIAQSEKRLAQISADYRRSLQSERAEIVPQLERARGELAKQAHRHELLELRAPQDGIVKDLATHTPGTVVAPGTILMTIVPRDERLRAEIWVSNDDIGFVRAAQPTRLKLAAFQFQKFGMLDGEVIQVSADASESPNPNTRSGSLAGRERAVAPLAFRALVELKSQFLESDGRRYTLAPGMQVIAEIHLGERSVLEYLLSPVQKAFQEAGRER